MLILFEQPYAVKPKNSALKILILVKILGGQKIKKYIYFNGL